jgi:cation diffusion facilitator CzcD-associated flavoprotein CzcO
MLQRSPTYVLSMPRKSPAAKFFTKWLPGKSGRTAARWFHALTSQGFYNYSRRRPEKVKQVLIKGVTERLPEGYDVERHFTPRYNPWDERVCVVPRGDLFTAIREDRATVVTDTIDTFTSTGIRLDSGQELTADVVVTATGLEVLFLGGIEFSVDGVPLVPHDHLTYKGMMLDDVPNLAMTVGYTNASWTLKAELTCQHVCRILNHMRSTGSKVAAPHNNDPAVDEVPLMPLTSGYLQRAADELPRQGSRFPWQVHQSFLKDSRAMRKSQVDDGVIQFS